MNKGDEWEDSQCVDVWLHRYNIVESHPNCVVEVCEICGDQQFYTILDNGATDNMHYLSTHLREALPYHHPKSRHEYMEVFRQYDI